MFAPFTLGYNHAPTTSTYSCVQLQPFERGRILGLREAGWTYRRIATHVGHNASVVYHCFQQSSVEDSHTNKPGSGRPRNIDARQDRRIVRTALAARRASWVEMRAHVHLLCHQGPLGFLLTAVLRSRVSLARLPFTP